MKIQLADHFTYGRLLKFTFPSIVMMVFTSIYGVVDGLFISNFVGATPFAAINLIMPFLMIFSAIGFMIGTGGSALIAKTLGEGDQKKANEIFSLITYTLIIAGIAATIVGLVFLRQVAIAFGATGELLEYCVSYGRIILIALTPFMLQNAFQSLLITAEKPSLALAVIVAAGLTNVVLDALFIAVFKWGVEGAAIATAISQCVGGFIPLVYFLVSKKSLLKLGKTRFDGKALLKICGNGASEFMTNVSMNIVAILYNVQLMKFAGEKGVAAYGVIMYVNFIFIAVFLGFSMGSAPIVGYHYGAQHHSELKNLFKKSLVIVGVMSVVLTALAELFAKPLSMIFVSYDQELLDMTTVAFMLYSISFIFTGFNIVSSSFFTALNDGVVSAGISFSRTMVFQLASVLFLPIFLGINGVWLAIVVAEALALIVTIVCFAKYKTKYHYL